MNRNLAQVERECLYLLDVRSDAAWRQGRIVGAIHMPTATIVERAPDEIPSSAPVIVYCWGPGCNGSTKAALVLAELGYEVREMIGGYEYWAREGLPTEANHGRVTRRPDELTIISDGAGCSC